jgi:hypothetical protein
LSRAGYAIQKWARARIGKRVPVALVEREFRAGVDAETLPGVQSGAWASVREVAGTLPDLAPEAQVGLFG